MSDVLNIAVQCSSPVQIVALVVIIVFLMRFLNIFSTSVIKITGMVLSTVKHYHDASVKISGTSVNAELKFHNHKDETS